jgi:hypothetical protein
MTVEELGARLTSAEFTEWMIYDRLYGLPDGQGAWHHGLQASLFANAHGKKEREPSPLMTSCRPGSPRSAGRALVGPACARVWIRSTTTSSS